MLMIAVFMMMIIKDNDGAIGKRRDCSRVIAVADRLPRCISDSPLYCERRTRVERGRGLERSIFPQ